jgi:hypothetical protein
MFKPFGGSSIWCYHLICSETQTSFKTFSSCKWNKLVRRMHPWKMCKQDRKAINKRASWLKAQWPKGQETWKCWTTWVQMDSWYVPIVVFVQIIWWQESTSQLLGKFECFYSPNTPYLPYWSSDLWILNTKCTSCLNAGEKWVIWQSGFVTNCSFPCSHKQSVSIHTWIFYILCYSIVGNQRRFVLLMSRFELYYLQMDVLWNFSNVLHGVLLFPFPLNPVNCVCYYLGSCCPWQLWQL